MSDEANGSLGRCVRRLIAKHGCVRKCARALQIDAGYLSRLASGEKDDPGEAILQKLKIQKIIYWRLL